MRSGAYTVQQTLTAEAASVLKHSLSLARRRGHGQVTPLHVAATLLSSRSSLLRRACLKSQPHHTSQSHPLQCSRALELCFNVALNRLPTTIPVPLLHSSQPSLSNALIAALKRAQAHQRRGCIEQQQQQQQQQPLLTIKLELEQLIISILDDPSVSRVMREAGFTSTTIKDNIEDSSSALSDIPRTFLQTHFLANSSEQNPVFFSSQEKASNNYITDSLSLQAVSVPSGGLGLSLNASSVHDSQGLDKLTCCEECALNYEKDVQSIKFSQQKLLPPWLQPHGGNNASLKDEILVLSRKWNRLCHSLHQVRHNQNHLRSTMYSNKILSGNGYPYNSSYPLWPCQSNTDSGLKLKHSPNSVPKFRRQNSCTIEFNFGNGADHKNQSGEVPNLNSLKNSEDKEINITLGLGNSLFSDSWRQAKVTSELCRLLQDNVPWQSKSIPSITEALKNSKFIEKHTWLLIQGNDVIGKRRLASAIAESVFGSADSLLHMNMRYDEVTSCYDRLMRAFRNNERLVVLVENVDLADNQLLKLLADEFEAKGGIGQVQAIFILTKSICSSNEDGEMNRDSVIEMNMYVNDKSSGFGTSSSDNKRKADWDDYDKIKTSRIDEENAINKDLSRQSSHNTLDLNMKANEDDRIGFLELIPNRYVFDRNAAGDEEMKGFFMSKMKGVMEATFGGENVISFSVEEKVMGGILFGSSYFLNSLFEKWVKDIFQRGIETVKIGGKDGIHEIRLSYGGIREKVMGNGYMGTCLPDKIQVSYVG